MATPSIIRAAIGVVGLGAGTLAAYGRAGDRMRFYEISPDVIAAARSRFSFLARSPAQIEVAVGDGRIALEREPAQGFDALVLDAFSSDSVPIHLLTVEAFARSMRGIWRSDGVLLANVSTAISTSSAPWRAAPCATASRCASSKRRTMQRAVSRARAGL